MCFAGMGHHGKCRYTWTQMSAKYHNTVHLKRIWRCWDHAMSPKIRKGLTNNLKHLHTAEFNIIPKTYVYIYIYREFHCWSSFVALWVFRGIHFQWNNWHSKSNAETSNLAMPQLHPTYPTAANHKQHQFRFLVYATWWGKHHLQRNWKPMITRGSRGSWNDMDAEKWKAQWLQFEFLWPQITESCGVPLQQVTVGFWPPLIKHHGSMGMERLPASNFHMRSPVTRLCLK